MESYSLNSLQINLDKRGATQFKKASYPVRYGCFAEIVSHGYTYQFNLNGEIKYIQGGFRNWPDPSEWLKRTIANDWIYYANGGYRGVFSYLGEYYRPCFAYPSNSLFRENPLHDKTVSAALDTWPRLQTYIRNLDRQGLPPKLDRFLTRVARMDPPALGRRSTQLHQLIGGPLTVLPPDTRHVDYDVIPLIIADGCLYQCGFCRVKSKKPFKQRSRRDIETQLNALKAFYGKDLRNYNSVFLGDHDAFNASAGFIEFAATTAYKRLEFEKSYLTEPKLFLFGSVDSFLRSGEPLFEMLNRLPFYTYINLGFESADPKTLKLLQKPLTPTKVTAAFERMTALNRTFSNLEISANFILGNRLPEGHFSSLHDLLHDRLQRPHSKGAVYLSPLYSEGDQPDLLRRFIQIKNYSRLPTYLYLIQRL